MATVYDANATRCWSLATHIVGGHDEARTIVNAVFSAFSRNPIRGDADAVTARLTAETHREAVSAVRRTRTASEAGSDQRTSLDADARAKVDWSDAPLGLVEQLDTVPGVQRTVLLLAYLGGYMIRQIANQTHTAMDDVTRQMTLGLRALRTTT